MNNIDALKDLQGQVDKMVKGLYKTMDFQTGKLKDAIKDLEFKEQKKGKINKKSATMFLAHDNSIRIIFDNPEDGINFFENIK